MDGVGGHRRRLRDTCTSTQYIKKDELLRQVNQRGIVVEVLGCTADHRVRAGGRQACWAARNAALNWLLRNRAPGEEAGARWFQLRGLGYLDCVNGNKEPVRVAVDESSQLVLHDVHGGETRFYVMSGAYTASNWWGCVRPARGGQVNRRHRDCHGRPLFGIQARKETGAKRGRSRT